MIFLRNEKPCTVDYLWDTLEITGEFPSRTDMWEKFIQKIHKEKGYTYEMPNRKLNWV